MPPDANDVLRAEGADGLRRRLDRSRKRTKPADKPNGGARPIPLTAFEDIRMNTSARYLIDGIIPRGGLVVIWGPPGCGKSFLTFDMVMHAALGWSYREREVEQGPVVYCAVEAGHGFADRVEAFRLRHLQGHKDKVPFWLVAVPINLVGEHQALVAAIGAKVVPAVVVLDTLNRSLQGSESRDDDMGAYVKAADAIREAFGCAVVVVHHSGIEATRPRGHTSLIGAVDASVAIKRDSDGLITATVEKMRDGQAGAVLASRLEVLDVGRDRYDRLITSCVVAPAGPPSGTPKQRDKRRVPPKTAIVPLKSLRRALTEDRRDNLSMSLDVPQNAVVTTLESWRRYYYKSVPDLTEEARKKAFLRARQRLQDDDFIGLWGADGAAEKDILVWLIE